MYLYFDEPDDQRSQLTAAECIEKHRVDGGAAVAVDAAFLVSLLAS